MLQWGHGDEAVEETNSVAFAASATTLQWGHGDEAVEESLRQRGEGLTPQELQWGHGDEAVEER